MNCCINSLRVAIIAIPILLFFGSPAPSQAAPNLIEPEQFTCANVKLIPVSECKALVGMYSLNDENRPYTWFTTEVPCNWTGIDCSGENITVIDLHLHTLSSLPPEIGNLHRLETLNLESTGLSSLPPEIGNLGALKELRLSNNNLESLPNSLVQLEELTHLYVNHNYLYDLSPEIEAFILAREPGWPQVQRGTPDGMSQPTKVYLPIVAR